MISQHNSSNGLPLNRRQDIAGAKYDKSLRRHMVSSELTIIADT